MRITANEPMKDGRGSVGQYVTYFSIDGENNIAHRVNWFDPENNQVGLISDMKILRRSIADSITTIEADTVEWGVVV